MPDKKRTKKNKNNQSAFITLVEKHIIRRDDPRFEKIDQASFKSKNLYNLCNYYIRQAYIHENRYLQLNEAYKKLKGSDAYVALPRKVSNQVILQVYHDWGAYYEAMKVWRVAKDKFLGKPKIPKYKDKQKGRGLLVYEKGATSRDKKLTEQGIVHPSQLGIDVISEHAQEVVQVRVVARKTHYIVEVIYRVPLQENKDLNADWFLSVDLGISNLAALTSNKDGFRATLVNGRPLKAINQFYNKQKSHYQSILMKHGRHSSQRINEMGRKREQRINHYLHVSSRRIIDLMLQEKIGTLVIGKNKNWKQVANMGRKNNQQFVQIPFARFIDMLTYKAKLAGISVVIQEESYTSKCSFLDAEPVKKHPKYVGQRIKRGLFRSASGKSINADLNGSYNILRKVSPNAFRNGVEGAAVHPSRFILVN
jgi:putative transposase